MVLGQCMETMRTNQRAVARSLAPSQERMDTRDVKRTLALVPFRHSKLTEVLMDYFAGDGAGGGRAVMIVNVKSGSLAPSKVTLSQSPARSMHFPSGWRVKCGVLMLPFLSHS